jgi:hypothetical protein
MNRLMLFVFYCCGIFELHSSAMTQPEFDLTSNAVLGKLVHANSNRRYKFYENTELFKESKEIVRQYSPIQYKNKLLASDVIHVSTSESKIITPETLSENIVMETDNISDCTVILLWDADSHKTAIFHFSSMQYENITDPEFWISKYLEGIQYLSSVEAHLISSQSTYLPKAVDLLKRSKITNIKGIEVEDVFSKYLPEDNSLAFIYDPNTIERQDDDLYSKSTHSKMRKNIGINSVDGSVFH